MTRLEKALSATEPGFAELVRKIPLQSSPPLTPDWLRYEMLERHLVLRHAARVSGFTILEVGSGGHAISTVPLAYAVGADGRVLAVERQRWDHFREIVAASGLAPRIHPIASDARRLPLRDGSVDLAVCVHGIRSLESEQNLVDVFREMLRVAPRIFLAESLPIASSEAQRAHLAMYNLREEVFEAGTGLRDDLHYRPLSQLTALVERAGGVVLSSRTVEIDLPHALAYFPRSLVERIPESDVRDSLLRRWDEADALRARYGTEHPPVAVITAARG